MTPSTVGSISHWGLEVHSPDLTISLGEGVGMSSRIIVSQGATDVDRRLPASGASTPGFAIYDTGDENQPTGEPS